MLGELLSLQRSSPSADLHREQRARLLCVPLSALARDEVGVKSTDPSQEFRSLLNWSCQPQIPPCFLSSQPTTMEVIPIARLSAPDLSASTGKRRS